MCSISVSGASYVRQDVKEKFCREKPRSIYNHLETEVALPFKVPKAKITETQVRGIYDNIYHPEVKAIEAVKNQKQQWLL